MMQAIQPPRSIVTPRGWTVSNHIGATLPLEHLVRRTLEGMNRGGVLVFTGPGFGKTTALHHLAGTMNDLDDVAFLDEPEPPFVEAASRERRVVFTAGPAFRSNLRFPVFHLAPWRDDDLIEYLLANHRRRCASVMSRVLRDGRRGNLYGSPLLWTIVLDAMAADDAVVDCDDAIRGHIDAVLRTDAELDAAGKLALKAACGWRISAIATPAAPINQLLQHRYASQLLASERIAWHLARAIDCDDLKQNLPRELIRAVIARVSRRPAALTRLEALVAGRDSKHHSMAASVLAGVDPNWCGIGLAPQLQGAVLAGVRWSKLDLGAGQLRAADFSRAKLSSVTFDGACALETVFREATLRGASFVRTEAARADFRKADLWEARFDRAALQGAKFDGAILVKARFRRADLSGASFRGAWLDDAYFGWATLSEIDIEDADCGGADFSFCVIDKLALNRARSLRAALFRKTSMRGCDLSSVELLEPDFTCAVLESADFSDSILHNATFRHASLIGARLAAVDWECADLRDVDFTGASFHLGSTRSGLVGSVIACEGSRTDFYTDEFDERSFKNPAEIRKANLCGANLCGARVKGTDWYLVDLRGAKYTNHQAEHFARCGAILK